MPWDPGTPIDQRPAVVAAAHRRAAGEHVRAVRPAGRRRGRDRPLPALARRPARRPRPPRRCRIPTVPTLILQGGEDLRTPPEVSARDRGPHPRLGAARRPRHRALDRQRPAHLRARRDRPLHRRQVARRSRRASASRPASRPSLGAPESFESLRVLGRAPAQDRADRAARSRATLDDLRLVLSPAALAAVRRRPARRVVGDPRRPSGPRALRGRQRGHRDRQRDAQGSHCASAGPRPRAARSRCARAVACPGRSAAVASRSRWARRTSRPAKASVALKSGALTDGRPRALGRLEPARRRATNSASNVCQKAHMCSLRPMLPLACSP